MRTCFALAAATAGMMLAVSGASALDEKKLPMYVTGEGADRMVMGGELTEGAPVLAGLDGGAPAECPEGSFYEANDLIIACGDGGAEFALTEAAADTLMPSGEPYPQGAMILETREGN